MKFKQERIYKYPFREVVDFLMESGEESYDINDLDNVTDWKVVKEEDTGDKVIGTKEWCAHAQIPKALQHIVTPKMLTWLEHSEWDRKTTTYKFTIVPFYLANKVDCRGQTKYVDKNGHCARIFEVGLKVKIPVFGPMFENVVLGLLKNNEETDYKLCQKTLKKKFG